MKLIFGVFIFYVVFSTYDCLVFNYDVKNDTDPEKFNVNGIVDTALERIGRILIEKNLDPLNLPDFERNFPFRQKKFQLHIRLSNNWIQGLHLMSRSGDTTFKMGLGKAVAVIPLNFENLEFGLEYDAKIFPIARQGLILGSINGVELLINATVNLAHRNLTLNQIKITNGGTLHVEDKNHIDDFVVNGIIEILIDLFYSTGVNAINKLLDVHLDWINKEIASFKFHHNTTHNNFN